MRMCVGTCMCDCMHMRVPACVQLMQLTLHIVAYIIRDAMSSTCYPTRQPRQ